MTDLDFLFQNNNEPKKGSLLLSEPFMSDQYFGRAVILLCSHDEKGSFGFVLNNYIDINLNKLDDSFPKIKTRISVGGPVDTKHLYYIHSLGNKIDGSVEITDGIFLGGDYTKLISLLKKDINLIKNVRFFLGYSGWDANQLLDEFKEKSWVAVNNINDNVIMNDAEDNLWQYCMSKQGNRFKVMSNFPIDPNFN